MSSINSLPFGILEQEYLERKQRIADLSGRRITAEQELEEINKQLGLLLEPTELVQTKRTKPATKVVAVKASKSSNGNKKSASEMAKGIIKQFKRPMHVNELGVVMLKRGYKTVSDNTTFFASVASILARQRVDFVKTAPNTFDVSNRHVEQ